VLKAQVEISVLLNRLVQLEQQKGSLEALINRLLGRPSHTRLGQPVPREMTYESPDVEGILPEAESRSAALVTSDRRIAEQQATVDLVRKDRRPDLMPTGGYMNRGSLPGIWEINVGFTLPVRKSSRQDREIEENLRELDARRSDRADAVQAVELTVQDSYLRADRAVRLVDLYGDAIIPQAVLSLESAMAGYGVGNVDFLTLLDNVITVLTYRLELEREQTDYATAIARIEEHVGRSLGATPAQVWRSTTPTSAAPEQPVADWLPRTAAEQALGQAGEGEQR